MLFPSHHGNPLAHKSDDATSNSDNDTDDKTSTTDDESASDDKNYDDYPPNENNVPIPGLNDNSQYQQQYQKCGSQSPGS
jgi:hypothetical protein